MKHHCVENRERKIQTREYGEGMNVRKEMEWKKFRGIE